MAEVVLFYPKLETVKPRLLPMSVLTVAAPLVKNGFSVKIVDQRTDENWRDTLLEEIKQKPLFVGLSSKTGRQIKNALEASRLVKENSDIPTVWGGVHPSLLPAETLKNVNVDFVIIGEGEQPVLKLAEALKNGLPYEHIAGLGYKKDGSAFYNPQKDFVNLDESPEIPYDFINTENYIENYSFATGKPGRNIAFYTSRGCPHRCGFCYNQEFNKRRWRGESAERLVERMKRLVKDYGVTAFEIEDDEFFVDMNRAKRVCELLIKEKLNVEIFTTCRVNYVQQRMDDALLKLCFDAGFKSLAFGVESGSKRVQEMMAKDITNEQVFETIKRLKKAGIGSKYYFISGAPTETTEELYETADLIRAMKKLDQDIIIPPWRVFTPYPGTEMYSLAKANGFVPPGNLEHWAEYDFKKIKMPWISKKTRRIIENGIYSIGFLELKKTGKSGLYFKMSRMYGKTVDYRWKKRWFYFPEKKLIDFIKKIKRKIYG